MVARGGPIREANQEREQSERPERSSELADSSRKEYREGGNRAQRFPSIELGGDSPCRKHERPLYGAVECLVARGGIEPPTRGFSVSVSGIS